MMKDETNHKKQHRPCGQRDPHGIVFTLTARDVTLLETLARYRYLRTGQIHRLLFGKEGANPQVARRRLRYLFHHGYVGRIMPFVRQGSGVGEVAYHLDHEGVELLRSRGYEIPAYARGGEVKRLFLDHAIDISEFRLNLETALDGSDIVMLDRFITDFEMRQYETGLSGKRRYLLLDQVEHPITKHKYTVYPDAVFVLRGRGTYERFSRLYMLEIDRGTEGLSIIRDKIIGYTHYRRAGLFQKYGTEFGIFRVLIQAPSERRLENIRSALTDLEGADMVWGTAATIIKPHTLLSEPIWSDMNGVPQRIIRIS